VIPPLTSPRIPSLIAENERLRLLLSLSRRLSSSYVAAECCTRRRPRRAHAAAERGARDGVAAFDPVWRPEGLIGVVLNVAERDQRGDDVGAPRSSG